MNLLHRLYPTDRRRCILPFFLLAFLSIAIVFLNVVLATVLWRIPITESRFVEASSFLLGKKALVSCQTFGCLILPYDIDGTKHRLIDRGDSIEGLRPSTNTTTPNQDTFALVTWRSNDRPFNQDRAALIQPFTTKQTPLDSNQASFLTLVLDGHGVEGHSFAQYVMDALPTRLAEKLNAKPCGQPDDWIQQQLIDTFVQVDQIAPPLAALRGGCTASVALRIGSKLYLANAGDSRTIVVSYEKKSSIGHDPHRAVRQPAADAQVVYSTVLDKAHLPEERARIEKLGGKIHVPKKNHSSDSSRVVLFSEAAQPPEYIGLAMSRSLGDWEWKTVGVTAEPRVQVVEVPQGSASFLLAATDGVWDMRRLQFFANYFAEALSISTFSIPSFEEGVTSTRPTPLKTMAARALWQVAPANLDWYRDDMTLLVVDLSTDR